MNTKKRTSGKRKPCSKPTRVQAFRQKALIGGVAAMFLLSVLITGFKVAKANENALEAGKVVSIANVETFNQYNYGVGVPTPSSDGEQIIGRSQFNIPIAADEGLTVNGTTIIDSSGKYYGDIGTAYSTTSAMTFGSTVAVPAALTTLSTLSVTSTALFTGAITATGQTLAIGTITATGTAIAPNTLTYISATNVTSTNYLAASTLVWGVNAGTVSTSTRSATTSTHADAARTCWVTKTNANVNVYVSFDNTGSMVTSTSPCTS